MSFTSFSTTSLHLPPILRMKRVTDYSVQLNFQTPSEAQPFGGCNPVADPLV